MKRNVYAFRPLMQKKLTLIPAACAACAATKLNKPAVHLKFLGKKQKYVRYSH